MTRRPEQPGADDNPLFDVEAIREDVESRLEALEGLRDEVEDVLNKLEESVDMEANYQGDVAHLRAEMISVALAMRAEGDEKTRPYWLRLLGVAEFTPELPPKKREPTEHELEEWGAMYGDDAEGWS